MFKLKKIKYGQNNRLNSVLAIFYNIKFNSVLCYNYV